jgi:hypothetical protein
MGYAFAHWRAPAYDYMLTFSHGGALGSLGLGTGNFHFGSPSRLAEIKTTLMLLGFLGTGTLPRARLPQRFPIETSCRLLGPRISRIRCSVTLIGIYICPRNLRRTEKPETAARQPKIGPDTASSAGFLVTAFSDLSSGRLRSKPRTPSFISKHIQQKE